MSQSLAVCARFVLALIFTAINYYDAYYTNIPDHKITFGGRYKYLTILNVVFLTVTLLYSSACDLVSKPSFLHRLRGLLCGASATMSMFVAAMFWSLYIIDRELVFPKALDAVFPAWLNHAVHTAIVPASYAALWSLPRRHAPKFGHIFALCATLALGYVAWIHVIHNATGRWIYPVLAVLDVKQRVAFIAACATSTMPFSFVTHRSKAWMDAWLSADSGEPPAKRQQRKARRQKAAKAM